MLGRSRSVPEIPHPSHWEGPKEVILKLGVGVARFAALPPSRIPQADWACQGSRGLAPRWAPIAQQRHARHNENCADATYKCFGQPLFHQPLADNVLENAERARQMQLRREDSIARLAAKRTHTIKAGLERQEPYCLHRARAERRTAHLQADLHAPLLAPVTFLPRLPQIASLAKRTWAADAAPPHSPWEARDVLSRVEELNDGVGQALEVIGLWQADNQDSRFVKKLRKRLEQRKGYAPQPWQFRLGTPSDVDEMEGTAREEDAEARIAVVKTLWG